MKVVVVFLLLCMAVTIEAAGLDDLEFLIGKWRGVSRGEPGEGISERECTRILNDRFIECRTTATYKNEVHVERSIFSFDKRTKKLRLRQFHGEGFVNSYVEGDPLIFTTVEIENIPDGWRARETYKAMSPDSWSETFELAMPGKELEVYSSVVLERVK